MSAGVMAELYSLRASLWSEYPASQQDSCSRIKVSSERKIRMLATKYGAEDEGDSTGITPSLSSVSSLPSPGKTFSSRSLASELDGKPFAKCIGEHGKTRHRDIGIDIHEQDAFIDLPSVHASHDMNDIAVSKTAKAAAELRNLRASLLSEYPEEGAWSMQQFQSSPCKDFVARFSRVPSTASSQCSTINFPAMNQATDDLELRLRIRELESFNKRSMDVHTEVRRLHQD